VLWGVAPDLSRQIEELAEARERLPAVINRDDVKNDEQEKS
jgi:hypothetical protein